MTRQRARIFVDDTVADPFVCRRFGGGPGCGDPIPHYHGDDAAETLHYLPTAAECAAADHPDRGDESCHCGAALYGWDSPRAVSDELD